MPKHSRPIVAVILLFCAPLGCQTKATRRYVDRPELTPLMNAAASNDLPRVQKLLASGANVHERTKEGQTPLYEAIERRDLNEDNLPIATALLNAGADPNEVEFTAADPLSVSLTRDYGNPAVSLLLLHSGAHVPTTCPADDSVLSLATQDSSVEVMQQLMLSGAPTDCRDKRGASALYWAVLNCQPDRVTTLLRGGANPNLPDPAGHSMLNDAKTTNPEKRVQNLCMKTREILLAFGTK
jgi:ankyrin repeat protein